MPRYREIKGNVHYIQIACYRLKFIAEGYAVTLRDGFTTYVDIQVVEEKGGWWCVYGLPKMFA